MHDMLRRYLPDIAVGILTAVISIIWFLEGNPLTVPYFICGCVILWSAIQYFYYQKLMKTGILTNAVLIDYHCKLEKQKPVVPSAPIEYTSYAPVMQYETETEVITSQYSLRFTNRKYQIGKTYQIYYLPSMPEMFWFPGEESAVSGAYLFAGCSAVMFLIIYLINHAVA